jgi:hypothetical protein
VVVVVVVVMMIVVSHLLMNVDCLVRLSAITTHTSSLPPLHVITHSLLNGVCNLRTVTDMSTRT